MSRELNHLVVLILVAFAVVSLALGYWAIVRGPEILAGEDNPRLLDHERAVVRGAIYDRDGRLLAESVEQDDVYTRVYPYPRAAPAVGYYSLFYGAGGVEAEADTFLSGALDYSAWDALLHYPQVGGDVQLTLDLGVQLAASDALGDRAGAVVVVEADTGAVLALVSSPTFDPNTLDDSWDALVEDPASPLLNRATQGEYQPGAVLQTILLYEALQDELSFGAEGAAAPVSLRFNGDAITLTCAQPPPGLLSNLEEAYAYGCPAPFAQVGQALGVRRLAALFERFELVVPGAQVEDDPVKASLGQGALTVSPAQMARVAAAVANGGDMPVLHLISHTRAPGGEWTGESVAPAQSTITSDAARQLREAMPAVDDEVIGHVGLALSGPDGALAWFIGVGNAKDGRPLAVAVVVEAAGDAGEATRIGAAALGAARAGDG